MVSIVVLIYIVLIYSEVKISLHTSLLAMIMYFTRFYSCVFINLSLCLLGALIYLLLFCSLTFAYPYCFGARICFNAVVNVSIVLLKQLSNIHFPFCLFFEG